MPQPYHELSLLKEKPRPLDIKIHRFVSFCNKEPKAQKKYLLMKRSIFFEKQVNSISKNLGYFELQKSDYAIRFCQPKKLFHQQTINMVGDIVIFKVQMEGFRLAL
eukprot:TRINITY_DN1087_c0_g2_i1.p1 TRINITY_DN1087_c0_g2~~TRINITY_DN1087_c0_g2_i1.p1  ORF type:complete len:106 (+),score=3.50 TRINITY_DN1087_c0_g2_i1:632-949(+)